jgi:hypothetical protein
MRRNLDRHAPHHGREAFERCGGGGELSQRHVVAANVTEVPFTCSSSIGQVLAPTLRPVALTCWLRRCKRCRAPWHWWTCTLVDQKPVWYTLNLGDVTELHLGCTNSCALNSIGTSVTALPSVGPSPIMRKQDLPWIDGKPRR